MNHILNKAIDIQPSATMVANRRIADCQNDFNMLIDIHEDGMRRIFLNPSNISPSDILAAMGTDAKEVLEFYESLKTFIESLNGQFSQMDFSYTKHSDGTVTIN